MNKFNPINPLKVTLLRVFILLIMHLDVVNPISRDFTSISNSCIITSQSIIQENWKLTVNDEIGLNEKTHHNNKQGQWINQK